VRLSTRGALAVLAALTLLRLAVAAFAPLSPDEAYYWVWSRALAPGYLDHPPMVALWIRAGTALAGQGALGVRLLAPFAAAFGSVLLARAADDLVQKPGAGLLAAGFLNATLLLGVGAVTMTPDTPLLFFWTATLFALARLCRSGNGTWWLVAGLAAGLALCSKYTGLLLVLAVGLWLVADPGARRWLPRWQPWAGLLIAALLFLPTVLWNARHGWPSFAKQGGRALVWQPAAAAGHFGELLAGQIGLATPLVFALGLAGICLALRRSFRYRDSAATLLAAATIVPALVFVEHALGDRVQANWPAIVYPGAAIAAAGLTGRVWSRLAIPAIGLGAALVLAVYVQAIAAPVPLSGRRDPTLLRLGGWPRLAAAIDAARRGAGASYVASDEYGEAAELARLLPPDVPVIGIAPRWALFALPDGTTAMDGRPGLLVQNTRRDAMPGLPDAAFATEIGTIERARRGIPADTYRLYRIIGRRGSVPSALLPHP